MTLGTPELPAGDTKNDEYFGKQVVYHNGSDRASARDARRRHDGAHAVSHLPGLRRGGPVLSADHEAVQLNMANASNAATSGPAKRGTAGRCRCGAIRLGTGPAGAHDPHRKPGRDLASFFGLGLLLAFTPCVLPMVPILSGLIAGQGANVTTARAFLLSLTYVLGMAITYTVAGAAFAAAGQQVQAVFQQPWIILLFAALFIALALSMFGLFTLQMPAAIQTRLASTSNRQRAGTFGGVAVMGALSALIVTACVAPALVGALLVIGQSGDVVRGAVALFAMSLGMGAPLLVIGTSAGQLLPRAGAWMDTVKQLFGALMLGVAAWMLARLVGDRSSAAAVWRAAHAAIVVVLWQSAGSRRRPCCWAESSRSARPRVPCCSASETRAAPPIRCIRWPRPP